MPLTPASPFAALLRRSKFASLDTSIAQVYTSSGGDLYRGNWGLKRPLPIRRRGAHITVKAVDSKEQQTEWNVADQQAKWIDMWGEVGITPTVREGSPWHSRLGSKVLVTDEPFDSEFSKGVRPIEELEGAVEGNELIEGEGFIEKGEEGEVVEAQSQELTELTEEEQAALEEKNTLLKILDAGPGASMPNIYSMSDSEFEKYLEKVRTLRPTFLAYRNLDADAKRRETQETQWLDMHEDHGSRLFKTFLAKHAETVLTAPSSRTIEQQPQHIAGLAYARTSLLQSFLLTPPQPGRVLNKYKPSSGSSAKGVNNVASFAGMLPTLVEQGLVEAVDWKRLDSITPTAPGKESGKYRFIDATLLAAPAAVGQTKGGLKEVYIDSSVKRVTDEALKPHLQPGTREYCGWEEEYEKMKSTRLSQSLLSSHFNSTLVHLDAQPLSSVNSKDVLDNLEGILAGDQKDTGA
ncbi:mitochondrial ribosomal protein subunit-domain-containing protein [Irpex rosettiformis]|uniref:Mitochondrial ribosomal protein subunit-domain-containing protein n=1 Tax=Irpex rosettiformis TaxID=378272 RepID=A0ACB8UHB6_9APHY|nr:mitochondrial ribosomal protein subunit-domain-containing protein [Irpex rosettiformis]